MLTGLIGAGVGALGGIVSNAIGAKNQRETNRTNLAINQMNNEFSERMMMKQMRWNEDMWNKQNEWNSAASQMNRYRDAGLNPYLMMQNGGSAGVSSNPNSVSAPQASQAGFAQAYKPDAGAFSSLADSLIMSAGQAEVRKQEAEGLRINNDYLRAEKVANLALLEGKIMSSNLDNQSKKEHLDILRASKDELMKSATLDNELKRAEVNSNNAQAALAGAQKALADKKVQWYDETTQADLSLKAAQTFEMFQRGILNIRQAELAIKNGWLAAAQAKGQQISNEIAGALAKEQIATMLQQYKAMGYEGLFNQRYWMQMSNYGYDYADWDKFIKETYKLNYPEILKSGIFNQESTGIGSVVSGIGNVALSALMMYLTRGRVHKPIKGF